MTRACAITRLAGLWRRLRRERRAVTAVEFAVAAPVLLVLLLGIYDMGHTAYLGAVLHGAVQQAGRSDALETSDTAAADAYVTRIVRGVAPGAKVTATRVSYYDFADVERSEAWNDNNNNGICDKGESYTDENKNGHWDEDIGKSGNGGANDVVLYTVKVTYKPVFSVPFTTLTDGERTMTASAVKKNQPYALQQKYGSAAGTCP
ncbi:TadE/TadG family type IV pilus assembly protein [Novosphingobium soli]|uniref:TadE/TadG family type IV pilus assembly protein n=1 Tax=Novosphingobium soli TaxID=574956 RepID=A0ABV6CVP2_9SPHN